MKQTMKNTCDGCYAASIYRERGQTEQTSFCLCAKGQELKAAFEQSKRGVEAQNLLDAI